MRNQDKWQPTKVRLTPGGGIKVPAARKALAPGSVAVAAMLSRWYAEILPRHARGRLLDLGCGKAPYLQLYRPHVDEVLCTDWAKSLHGDEFLDFVSDFENFLPLADCSVDTILLADVLEHVFRPQQVIAEAFRILTPGGVLILHSPLMYVVHEAPHDYFRYTQFAMKRMAEEAGFNVELLDPLGGKLIAFADVTGKILQGMTLVGAGLAIALQRAALALSKKPPRTKKFAVEIAAVLRKPL